MPYSVHIPPQPSTNLEKLSDEERKFTPRTWNLSDVQEAVRTKQLSLQLSGMASTQVMLELSWSSQHLEAFFLALGRHHYLKSEWVYVASEPKINGYPITYACDVYSMGFNKGLLKENEKSRPYVYCKFTVKEAAETVLITNIHPEKDIKDRSR